MTRRIAQLRDRIADFCRRRGVREFAVFGSAVRDELGPDSDVDVLVTFEPGTHYSLFELGDMREELRVLFGRDVDLVEKPALRNPFRRKAILDEAEVVYAA